MIRDTSAQDRSMAAQRVPLLARLRLPGVLALLAIGLGYGLYSWSGSARAVNAERLRIASVTRGDLVRDAVVNGRVVAANSPTLYAPFAGTVAIRIAAGDQVSRGQLLASIDSPELTSEFDREQAMLEQLEVEVARQRILAEKQKLLAKRTADEAELALVAAERDAQRSERAYQRGALSQVEWLQAQDAVNAARIKSQHAAADVALEGRSVGFELQTKEKQLQQQRLLVGNLQRRIEELNIKAPVDGVVGTLAVADRAVVAPNSPLMTVVDLSHLEADLEVPESYADELGIGMQVELRVGTMTTLATISAVSPEVVANQVLARVRFNQAKPEGLRQNQRLSARILFEERADVLTLARGPFLEASGGRFAYVLDEGVAVRREIRVGATSVSAIEILDGLQPGDQVVIAGTENFADAERVAITP